jgi:chemotaxis protein methyltransferase CheR
MSDAPISPSLTEAGHDLTDEDYERFRRLVYQKTGINLGQHKQQLVRARLGKRVRGGGFSSYRAYYEHVLKDASGEELRILIDAIATNTTHLFREQGHFEFLARTLRACLADPRWRAANREVRFWSAGCSSGDEPYSIAMTVCDVLASATVGWRILATDISSRILEQARAGVYDTHRLGAVPPAYRQRYFVCVGGSRGRVQVSPALKERVRFAAFNLMSDPYPFRHGFNYIFCRNVMIYFDRRTQEQLVDKFTAQLRPEGYLIIGHSESLNAIRHTLKYVQPTIYQRADA